MSQHVSNTAIDQLWYTWSHRGLEDIHAGYRIRAASAGLHSTLNIRVQALDRFQRYQLPQGADPVAAMALRNPGTNNGLNVAPICLSLINTGQERILVHKVYTGRDAVGRPGVFFVHLLAGLPENFTATQAIQLWKSPFWQHSDVTLQDERSTLLDQVSLEQVMATAQPFSYTQQHFENLDKYLAYVIHAYLLMQDSSIEKAKHATQQFYIAASDENLARLLRGLTRCLPQPLLKDLTFSTYERTPEEAETQIVGTGWLTLPNVGQNEETTQLLPARYYQERLALNCYSGEKLVLENNLYIENKPIAAVYAYRAKQYFLEAINKTPTLQGTHFKKFLDAEKDCSSVEHLLKRFEQFLQDEQHGEKPVPAIVPGIPSRIPVISGAIRAISGLSIPARSPVDMIREAIPVVVETIKSEIATGEPAATNTTRKITTCEQLVDYMKRNIAPQQESELWIEFLLKLRSIPAIASFFFTARHWNCYKDVLGQLARTLPDANTKGTLLAPLLAPTWPMLGTFLQLPLPPGWTILALQTLAFAPTSPTADDAHSLAELHHAQIRSMFNELWLEKEYQQAVILLLSKLNWAGYPWTMDVVKPLLRKGASPHTIAELLNAIRTSLTKDELALIFEDYVVAYIPYYSDSNVLLDYVRDYFYGLINGVAFNNSLEDAFDVINRKLDSVVDCIMIVIINTVFHDDSIMILWKLAFMFTVNVKVFKEIMNRLVTRWQADTLSSLSLFLFFYDLALYIGEDISTNPRKQELLIPCIAFADIFNSSLPQKSDAFIRLFTEALLLYANKTVFQKLLNQLEKELKNAGPWKVAIQRYRRQKLLSMAYRIWQMQKELPQGYQEDIEYKALANNFANKSSYKTTLLRDIYTLQTYEMRRYGRAWIQQHVLSDDISQAATTQMIDRKAGSNS